MGIARSLTRSRTGLTHLSHTPPPALRPSIVDYGDLLANKTATSLTRAVLPWSRLHPVGGVTPLVFSLSRKQAKSTVFRVLFINHVDKWSIFVTKNYQRVSFSQYSQRTAGHKHQCFTRQWITPLQSALLPEFTTCYYRDFLLTNA